MLCSLGIIIPCGALGVCFEIIRLSLINRKSCKSMIWLENDPVFTRLFEWIIKDVRQCCPGGGLIYETDGDARRLA